MSGATLNTVSDLWDESLGKFPRKTALIAGGRAWSYAEADAQIDRIRAHLADRFGLRPGETVAVCLPNCGEYFLAYWAIVRSGAVVVPINTRLGHQEMVHLLANCDARVLFVHADTRGLIDGPASEVDAIEHVVAVDHEAEDRVPWEALLEDGLEPPPAPERLGDDIVILMHTSGTTGVPKGAIMRHRDILFNIQLAIMAHSLRHEDVHLLLVPMFHATALYSLLPAAAYQGSTICVAEKPEVPLVLDRIETHRVTTLMGVPTFFHFLVSAPGLEKRDLSSLKVIGYAGSMMPPRTIEKLREAFPGVLLHNFFGLTETISMTHVLPSQDAVARADSIGKLLPQVHQRIVRADGTECDPDEVGELCLHRDNVICGYWKRPGMLEESIVDGYFRTGDLAVVDEDGYVYLRGREKDMIIVGGENVYAQEVEACILQHEAVRETAVVGIPATGVRAWMGELVKAVVVLQDGAEAKPNDIRRHCAERLASYKVPQKVSIAEALPRTPTGKVVKAELKGQ